MYQVPSTRRGGQAKYQDTFWVEFIFYYESLLCTRYQVPGADIVLKIGFDRKPKLLDE